MSIRPRWCFLLLAVLITVPAWIGAFAFHDPVNCQPPQGGCPANTSWFPEPTCACVNNACKPPQGGCPEGTEWYVDPETGYCGCIGLNPCEDQNPCDCDEMLYTGSSPCHATCIPIQPPFSCGTCQALSGECMCEPDPDPPVCCDVDRVNLESYNNCQRGENNTCFGSCTYFQQQVCTSSECCEQQCDTTSDLDKRFPLTLTYPCQPHPNPYTLDCDCDLTATGLGNNLVDGLVCVVP